MYLYDPWPDRLIPPSHGWPLTTPLVTLLALLAIVLTLIQYVSYDIKYEASEGVAAEDDSLSAFPLI